VLPIVEGAAGSTAVLCPSAPVITQGVLNMMRAKAYPCGVALACSILMLAGVIAAADDKAAKDKPALTSVWMLDGGEMKIEFVDKKVMKLFPHGNSDVIVILCEYTIEKEGRVKAKITDFEGKDDAKEKVKEILPVGTEFSFKWKVKNETAKLDELKGEKVEALKSHLEGEYKKK
jgi:hypothetical protein